MTNAFDTLIKKRKSTIPDHGIVPAYIQEYIFKEYKKGTCSQIKFRQRKGLVFYLYSADKKIREFQLPKIIAEIHLGRRVRKGEIIDWSDPDNPKPYRPREESRELLPQKCPICNKMFAPTWRQYKSHKTNPTAGPFCSRVCVYRYRKLLKDGADPIPPTPIVRKEEPLTLDSYFRKLYTK